MGWREPSRARSLLTDAGPPCILEPMTRTSYYAYYYFTTLTRGRSWRRARK